MCAFEGCDSITKITIPSSVTSIGTWAFYRCVNLNNIEVDVNNQQYSSENGVLFNKEKTELIYYPRNKEGKTYVIPNSTEKIHRKAFKDSMVTEIIIQNSMTEIGDAAFEGAKELVNVTIPSTVTKIEDYEFSGCT